MFFDKGTVVKIGWSGYGRLPWPQFLPKYHFRTRQKDLVRLHENPDYMSGLSEEEKWRQLAT
jgi:hypothetical protein